MFAKTRLFHNADKTMLVHEDNEEASFLYANTGDEIPESAAELYGLVDGDLPKAKGAKSVGDKGKKAGADKSGTGDDDKSGTGDDDKSGTGDDDKSGEGTAGDTGASQAA